MVRGVDQGLRGVPGEDREGRLVVGVEAVPAALATRPGRPGRRPRRSSARGASTRGRSTATTVTAARIRVRHRPAGCSGRARRPSRSGPRRSGPGACRGVGSFRAGERALERDRLAGAGVVIDAVDPDRVVLDEAARLGHDGAADAPDVVDPVQADGQVGDRAQPVGQRPRRLRPAGRCRWPSPCGPRSARARSISPWVQAYAWWWYRTSRPSGSPPKTIGTKQIVRMPARR